ncbi:hypothetical protein RDI58_004997 [Solanum bulbocastanum]|uniref:Uncharacterized protein n=1 Tax=Solanum bulbocastanum TaxID=147425 RepID=A0AAN8TZM0_SOLBU
MEKVSENLVKKQQRSSFFHLVAWIEDYNILHWTNQHAVGIFFSELLCEVCALCGILSRDSVTHFT